MAKNRRRMIDHSEEEAMENQQYQQQAIDFPRPQGNNSNDASKQSGGARSSPLKPHQCDFCVWSFTDKSHLDRHLIKHTGENPHECDFCPKRFTRKESLRRHMKSHVDEFLFNRSVCLQGFNGKEAKVTHGTNCKVRRFECYLCKNSFDSHEKQVIHMRVHSGDKPFHCNECFKQFTVKYSLKCHMKLHSDPMAYECYLKG